MDRSDEELIGAARRGEAEAFEALMRRHERLVYRVVSGFGRDRDDALDLCQIVFLKAFRALATFRSESTFRTWLLRIAHHEGLNRARAERRRGETTELDAESPELAAPAEQETGLLERERSGRIGRALGALHGRYRTAILLRYRDGMPIKEIAGVLDVSETMTKNLLFRGVRQLRRAIAEGT